MKLFDLFKYKSHKQEDAETNVPNDKAIQEFKKTPKTLGLKRKYRLAKDVDVDSGMIKGALVVYNASSNLYEVFSAHGVTAEYEPKFVAQMLTSSKNEAYRVFESFTPKQAQEEHH